MVITLSTFPQFWAVSFLGVVDVDKPTTSATKTAASMESEDHHEVERTSVVSESSQLTTVTDTVTTTAKTSLGESLTHALSELTLQEQLGPWLAVHSTVINISDVNPCPFGSSPWKILSTVLLAVDWWNTVLLACISKMDSYVMHDDDCRMPCVEVIDVAVPAFIKGYRVSPCRL